MRPSGTMAMPRRARASAGMPVTSLPSKRMRPARGGCRPVSARSSVVLPAPLAPMSASTSPAASDRPTPEMAWKSP